MAIDQIASCLKRHDKQHRDVYEQEHRIGQLVERLGNIRSYICTEDKSFAGDKPRVDLYVETEKGHVLVELKLCITSGGTLGRQLLSKVVSTLENLMSRSPASVKDADVLVVVPRGTSLERVCNYLIRGLTAELRAADINIGADTKCAPSLAYQGAYVLRTRRPIALKIGNNMVKLIFHILAI